MENRIPVPTDNIFKFYALFGLLLFVFACGALLYVNTTSNALMFESIPELEALKEFETPSRSDLAQIAVLERKIEITNSNKKFYYNVISVLGGLGFLMAIVGFGVWHTRIQPILDETAAVQLEIAKLHLQRLQKEFEPSPDTQAINSPVPASKTNTS